MNEMSAFEHASYCSDCATSLYREFVEMGIHVEPVFHKAIYTWRKGSLSERKEDILCYVHPEDLEVENVEDFKYPHREL